MPSANFEAAAKAVKQLKAKPSQDELLQVGYAVFEPCNRSLSVPLRHAETPAPVNPEIGIEPLFATGLTSKRQFGILLESASPLGPKRGEWDMQMFQLALDMASLYVPSV